MPAQRNFIDVRVFEVVSGIAGHSDAPHNRLRVHIFAVAISTISSNQGWNRPQVPSAIRLITWFPASRSVITVTSWNNERRTVVAGRIVEKIHVAQERPETGRQLLTFDTSVAHPARVWNYWVGGKDNFAADRQTAQVVMEAMPQMPLVARLARRFLIDAVGRLTTEYGVRQFLDIGTGLPTADNTHEVAQRIAPEARIVYADNDPIVLTHARALLTSSREGRTDYIAADLRDPDVIVAEAKRTLDFSEPIAVLLIGVLHFIPDRDDPFGIVGHLMDALPSGSFLVLGHAASDQQADAASEGTRRYNDRSAAPITMRDRDQIARFFAGLELLDPGYVSIGDWWPAGERDAGAASAMAGSGYVGIGRKP